MVDFRPENIRYKVNCRSIVFMEIRIFALSLHYPFKKRRRKCENWAWVKASQTTGSSGEVKKPLFEVNYLDFCAYLTKVKNLDTALFFKGYTSLKILWSQYNGPIRIKSLHSVPMGNNEDRITRYTLQYISAMFVPKIFSRKPRGKWQWRHLIRETFWTLKTQEWYLFTIRTVHFCPNI